MREGQARETGKGGGKHGQRKPTKKQGEGGGSRDFNAQTLVLPLLQHYPQRCGAVPGDGQEVAGRVCGSKHLLIYLVRFKLTAANWQDIEFADGHTASNAPDLFRPSKSSGAGPG